MSRYRKIPDFPGYRVGDDGSVWSRWSKGGNGPRKLVRKWRLLKLILGKRTGYYCVNIRHESGKIKQWNVHCLVLTVFVGPRPLGMEGCHSPDRTRTNNRLSNLRWDTRQANHDDAIRDGTHPRGEKHGRSKMKTEDVLGILAALRNGESVKSVSLRYGLCGRQVRGIRLGQAWKHLERMPA